MEVILMPWRPYNPGGGLAAPSFPRTVTFVAGTPLDGRGNVYTPNKPKGVGYGRNPVTRPGMDAGTLSGKAGSRKGLKFM